jgi:restriction endonuclease
LATARTGKSRSVRPKNARGSAMKPFSLDHLSDVEFEQFCFDLLGELGFINIRWRKGSGLSTSPSDRGRDIVCQRECEDVDGNRYFETWFVECKHSRRGVSPDKIAGSLIWAAAERPDRLLLVASNFFSNPTHDCVADYVRNNTPSFRIKLWERPDLEKLTITKSRLRRKYSVGDDFSFLALIHPAHLLYIKDCPLNTMGYLFSLLETLEPGKRDTLMGWVYSSIIRPRYREAITGKETLLELRIDEVSYEVFKKRCSDLTNVIEEHLLVISIVTFVLQAMLHIGNTTATDEVKDRFTHMIEFFERGDLDEGETAGDRNRFLNMLREGKETADTRAQDNYALYEYLCENIVSRLLLQNILTETGTR